MSLCSVPSNARSQIKTHYVSTGVLWIWKQVGWQEERCGAQSLPN